MVDFNTLEDALVNCLDRMAICPNDAKIIYEFAGGKNQTFKGYDYSDGMATSKAFIKKLTPADKKRLCGSVLQEMNGKSLFCHNRSQVFYEYQFRYYDVSDKRGFTVTFYEA